MLGKGEINLHAPLERLRVNLRHIRIHAQGFDGLHVKQLGARTLVDQLAGVDRARRDHAVKRRIDLFKGLQFFQPLQVGLRRFDGRGRSRGLRVEGVGVDLRYRVGFDKPRVAIGLHFGVPGIGLRGGEVGLGLRHLAIEFGGVDGGQQCALSSRARRCRSTNEPGSRRCARRWARPYRPSRCRAAQSCPPARRAVPEPA